MPHELHGELAAAAEYTLDTGGAHGVDDVARQPEGHRFGHRQDSTLVEGDAQVDVDQLGRQFVDENVHQVAVAQAQDVADLFFIAPPQKKRIHLVDQFSS